MKLKKLNKFWIVLLVLFLNSQIAYAQDYADIFKPVFDVADAIFGFANDPQYSHIFMRLIIWIVALNILLNVIRATPFWKKDDSTAQKYAKVIAMFLSLGGVAFLPIKTIEGMFYAFSIVIVALFIISIIQIVQGMAKTTGSKPAVVLLIISVAILLLNQLFFQTAPWNSRDILFSLTLSELMRMIGSIMMFYAIIWLLMGGGKKKDGADGDDDVFGEDGEDGEEEAGDDAGERKREVKERLKKFHKDYKEFKKLFKRWEDTFNTFTGLGAAPPGPAHNMMIPSLRGLSTAINALASSINGTVENFNTDNVMTKFRRGVIRKYVNVRAKFIVQMTQYLTDMNTLRGAGPLGYGINLPIYTP